MEKGEFARINYIGRLESGEIFDLTYEDIAKKNNICNPRVKYGPVVVVVGAGLVVNGLDKALLELSPGDKKTVTVSPEDGFGDRDPNMLKVMPAKYFKDPEQGKIVEVEGMLGRIQSVSAGRIRVDFNNPLAGKTLVYEVEVLEKITEPEKQVVSIAEFFGVENSTARFDGETAVIECKNISSPAKERISKLVIEHVKSQPAIKKVRFVEEYE